MNKRELKRPETVEVEAIGSFHLAWSWQSGFACEFAPGRNGRSALRASYAFSGKGFGTTRGEPVACEAEGFLMFSYRPVLKHGPRSLTYMRLCWCCLNHT